MSDGVSATCSCCGASALDVGIADVGVEAGLCVDCQPCPTCGRSGTGCTVGLDGTAVGRCESASIGWFEMRVGDLVSPQTLAGVDAIGHGVNCAGVAGAGVAKAVRQRWPEWFGPYRERCLDGRLRPGRGYAWATGEPGCRYVYHLATQDRPGRDARLDAVQESLTGALRHARAHRVRTVALPRIGAGIGGLVWADVRDVVAEVARAERVMVVVMTPQS